MPFEKGHAPLGNAVSSSAALERFKILAESDPEAAKKILDGIAGRAFVPHPGQRPVMDSHARFKLLCAGRRMGKSLRTNELIPTPDGFRPAGSVREGDKVFGRNGEPTKVTGVFPHADLVMYRLTFSDGAQIECCEDHLWQVRDKNCRPERTLDTKTIAATFIKVRPDGKREHRWKLARGAPVQYPQVALPLPPYVIGALLGDGALTQHPTLCANEPAIAERFKAEGMKLSKPSVTVHSTGTTITYGIHKIKAELESLGLYGHGFATKFAPEQYKTGSVQQRLDLLHGLMDTDGSVVRRRGATGGMGEFSVGSYQLALDAQEIARSLGGFASISDASITASGNPRWRVVIKLPLGMNLFWLPRKADLYQPRREPTRAITNVERTLNADGVCFEVEDPDSLYYAGRAYVLTHNTKIAAALALRTARRQKKMIWWVAPTYKIVKRGYAEVLRQLPPDVLTRAAPNERGFDAGRAIRLDFKTGSKMEFYSAERPEGMLGEGVDYAVLDEAATMHETVWTQIVRPTLADRSGGALFISTPRGRNWFYKMYLAGQDPEMAAYESWRFPSMANPHIPAEEWEEMEHTLPRAVYEQEILADFISNAAAVFTIPDSAIASIERPAGAVVLGIDLAKHNDFTVLCGVNSGNRKPCYHERFNAVSWPEQRRRIHAAVAAISKAGAESVSVVLDTTGIGDVVYDDLTIEGMDVIPIKFSNQWKYLAVMLLAADLERGQAFIHTEQEREFEGYGYQITEAGRWKFEALHGHDDEVSAALLAHWGTVNEGVPNATLLSSADSVEEPDEEDPWADYDEVEEVEGEVVYTPPSARELLIRGWF